MISKLTSFTSASLLAICLAASSADAATINLGGLDWETFGDAQLQDGGVALTTAFSDGNDDATNLNITGSDPLLAGGDLESGFGLPSGGLDVDDMTNMASEGSGFSRIFTVSVGDKITFDWQLFTAENLNADYGFFAVGGAVFTLATAFDATVPGSAGYLTQTEAGHYEYTFSAAGNFAVGFGVIDIGDAAATTALSISNVSYTAVPEPSTYALIALSSLGLCAFHRRQRKLTA